jgi:hypothetical protein
MYDANRCNCTSYAKGRFRSFVGRRYTQSAVLYLANATIVLQIAMQPYGDRVVCKARGMPPHSFFATLVRSRTDNELGSEAFAAASVFYGFGTAHAKSNGVLNISKCGWKGGTIMNILGTIYRVRASCVTNRTPRTRTSSELWRTQLWNCIRRQAARFGDWLLTPVDHPLDMRRIGN